MFSAKNAYINIGEIDWSWIEQIYVNPVFCFCVVYFWYVYFFLFAITTSKSKTDLKSYPKYMYLTFSMSFIIHFHHQ